MTTYNRDGSVDDVPTYQQFTTLPFKSAEDQRKILARIPPDVLAQYKRRQIADHIVSEGDARDFLRREAQSRGEKFDPRIVTTRNRTGARFVLRILDLALYGAVAWLVFTVIAFFMGVGE